MRDALLGTRVEGRRLPRARASTSTVCAPRSRRTVEPKSSSSPVVRSASASIPRDPRSAKLVRARASSSRRRGVRSRPGRAVTTSRSSSTRRHPSRTISRAATSRSTRWPVASPTASSSTRTAGRTTSQARVLRTVSPTSFAEDPLRLVRGLRFVSQLGLDPDETTLEQMRAEAEGVELVSGERIGGGIAADGLGELSKLLLGTQPAKALRIARDTGVLVAAAAGVRGGDRLRPGEPLPRPDRSTSTRSRSCRRRPTHGVPLARPARGALPRSRASRTSPGAARTGACTTTRSRAMRSAATSRSSAELADQALARLRYPTELRQRVVRIVRAHMLDIGRSDPLRARKLLARYGDGMLCDLLDHKEADLRGKGEAPSGDDLAEARAAARRGRARSVEARTVCAISRSSGDDLIALGYTPGPAIGQTLHDLLDDVVDEPELNTRRRAARRGRRSCSRDPLGAAGVRRRVHDARRRRQRRRLRRR